MTALSVLAAARAAGAELSARGNRIHVVEHAGPLPPEILAAVLENKGELLNLLAAEPPTEDSSGDEVSRDSKRPTPSTLDPYLLDPRADLAGDHALWRELLLLAHAHDGNDSNGLFQALHGLRCEGAQLERRAMTARLSPGEIDPTEYSLARDRWLLPHRSRLGTLLRAIVAPPGPVTRTPARDSADGERV